MKIYILVSILFLGSSNVWASPTCQGSSQGEECPADGTCSGFISTTEGNYQCGYSGGYGTQGDCVRISQCVVNSVNNVNKKSSH